MRLKAGIIYQEGQKSFHELNKYRDTNTMHPEPFEFYIDIFVLISRQKNSLSLAHPFFISGLPVSLDLYMQI